MFCRHYFTKLKKISLPSGNYCPYFATEETEVQNIPVSPAAERLKVTQMTVDSAPSEQTPQIRKFQLPVLGTQLKPWSNIFLRPNLI